MLFDGNYPQSLDRDRDWDRAVGPGARVPDGPAAAGEPLGDVGGRLASGLLSPEVNHADADRFDSLVDQVPPVPVLVPPLLVLRVGGGTIDLDAGAMIPVEVVQIAVAGCLPDPDLPLGGWKAVWALDSALVAEFEQRERAALRLPKR